MIKRGVRDMMYYLLAAAVFVFVLCVTIALDIKSEKKKANLNNNSAKKESNNRIYAVDFNDALMRADLSGSYNTSYHNY